MKTKNILIFIGLCLLVGGIIESKSGGDAFDYWNILNYAFGLFLGGMIAYAILTTDLDDSKKNYDEFKSKR